MKAYARKLALAVIFAGIPGLTFAAEGGWHAEVGKALGDANTAAEGKKEKDEGRAQSAIGHVKDAAREIAGRK